MGVARPSDLPRMSVGDLVRVVFYLEAPPVRCLAAETASHIREKWTEKELAMYCCQIDSLDQEESGGQLSLLRWRSSWPSLLFNGWNAGGSVLPSDGPTRSLEGIDPPGGPSGYKEDPSTIHIRPKEDHGVVLQAFEAGGLSTPLIGPPRTEKRPRREKGKKARTQMFEGTVIAARPVKGGGGDVMYTVRKNFKRTSAEKVFCLSSPLVKSFDVLRRSKVRRSKLYFLRGRTGKAARLRPLFDRNGRRS